MIKEAFDCGPWAYNIDQLRAILVQAPREPIPLDLLPLAKLVITGAAKVDFFHAIESDLTEPLLVVPRPVAPDGQQVALIGMDAAGVEQPWLVIDGWHRVANALMADLLSLPAYPFTVAEADSARILIPGRHQLPADLNVTQTSTD